MTPACLRTLVVRPAFSSRLAANRPRHAGAVQSASDVDLRGPSVFANESLIAVQGAVGPVHGAVTVASNASARQFGEASGAGASAACFESAPGGAPTITPNLWITICWLHVPATSNAVVRGTVKAERETATTSMTGVAPRRDQKNVSRCGFDHTPSR
jgi:hypothetical protein